MHKSLLPDKQIAEGLRVLVFTLEASQGLPNQISLSENQTRFERLPDEHPHWTTEVQACGQTCDMTSLKVPRVLILDVLGQNEEWAWSIQNLRFTDLTICLNLVAIVESFITCFKQQNVITNQGLWFFFFNKCSAAYLLLEAVPKSAQEWLQLQKRHKISPQCHHIWQVLLQLTDHWSSLELCLENPIIPSPFRSEPTFKAQILSAPTLIVTCTDLRNFIAMMRLKWTFLVGLWFAVGNSE